MNENLIPLVIDHLNNIIIYGGVFSLVMLIAAAILERIERRRNSKP
jgi:hypothetical protein